jgi:putative peptide maturation system protein
MSSSVLTSLDETGAQEPPPTRAARLLAAVALLERLAEQRLSPPQARRALDELRASDPGLELDLIEQRLELDGSYDYQLLVGGAVEGMLALALSRPDALPWPLRGVQRWSNDFLGSVNGRPLMVSDALVALECLGRDPALIRRLIDLALIEEELRLHPVQPSEADIQAAADAMRRSLGLLTPERTRRWLAERGLDERAFAERAANAAALRALQRRHSGGGVEQYFHENRDGLALVSLALLTVGPGGDPPPSLAPATDIYQLAEQLTRNGAAVSLTLRPPTPVFRLDPVIGGAITAAAPGATVGPLACDDGSVYAKLIDRHPARLDSKTVALIEELLFDGWLAERRSRASVRWYWGYDGVVERAVLRGYIPKTPRSDGDGSSRPSP